MVKNPFFSVPVVVSFVKILFSRWIVSSCTEKSVIEPTDRVKSVTDKEDPRFAAARQKADKEDRLRAARDRKAAREAGEEVDDEDEVEEPAAKESFSFNKTTQGEGSS